MASIMKYKGLLKNNMFNFYIHIFVMSYPRKRVSSISNILRQIKFWIRASAGMTVIIYSMVKRHSPEIGLSTLSFLLADEDVHQARLHGRVLRRLLKSGNLYALGRPFKRKTELLFDDIIYFKKLAILPFLSFYEVASGW